METSFFERRSLAFYIAVIGNQGANAGDIMPVNVVDLKGKAPRIVNTVDVGQYIEGLRFQTMATIWQ